MPVGDLDKSDVILTFLCGFQPFIYTELIWARFKLLDLTLVEPESIVTQIELVEMTIKDQRRLKTESPNGSSSWRNRVGKKPLIWDNSLTKKHDQAKGDSYKNNEKRDHCQNCPRF